MKRTFELEARANETGYGVTLRINGRAFAASAAIANGDTAGRLQELEDNMKIETAIENLNKLIDEYEAFAAFLAGQDGAVYNDSLHEVEKVDLASLRVAVRALEEKPRWIPCSERLPGMHEENDYDVKIKVSEPVLFCEKTGLHARVHIGVCKEVFEETWWLTQEWKTYRDVAAWMPLPEAYLEERNNNETEI